MMAVVWRCRRLSACHAANAAPSASAARFPYPSFTLVCGGSGANPKPEAPFLFIDSLASVLLLSLSRMGGSPAARAAAIGQMTEAKDNESIKVVYRTTSRRRSAVTTPPSPTTRMEILLWMHTNFDCRWHGAGRGDSFPSVYLDLPMVLHLVTSSTRDTPAEATSPFGNIGVPTTANYLA